MRRRAGARRARMALGVGLLALGAAGAVGVLTRDGPEVVRRDASFVSSLTGERAVVWAVGDGADGSDDAKAVAARIARGPVDRVLYLGDVYEDGTGEDFEENYATVYGRLASVTAPTSGNHDSDNERTGYDPYWRRAHGVSPPDWYGFRAGGWKILSLDSELSREAQSVQRRWLTRQLRAPGTCRIAFWHRPRFSAGTTHGDQEDVAPLWNALRGRAAIALAAHEHGLQRFKPIDGVTQFVSGAGGRELYDLAEDDRLAFGDDDTHGALRLFLRPGVAAYAFVAADGRTLDSGTVRCRPGPTSYPSPERE